MFGGENAKTVGKTAGAQGRKPVFPCAGFAIIIKLQAFARWKRRMILCQKLPCDGASRYRKKRIGISGFVWAQFVQKTVARSSLKMPFAGGYSTSRILIQVVNHDGAVFEPLQRSRFCFASALPQNCWAKSFCGAKTGAIPKSRTPTRLNDVAD